MGTRDPRIDAYIAKQKEFAKPILEHLRNVVHSACPTVEETLKWSSPFFTYKGSMLCHMQAFNQHAAFGFWKEKLIEGLAPKGDNGSEGRGSFGKLTSVKDLPSKTVLASLIKQAMRLNDEGITVPKPKKVAKPQAKVPAQLAAALNKNKKAAAHFENFPPSHRREYIEWIDEAKREETKATRVEQAVEWIAEGKGRNWKYQTP